MQALFLFALVVRGSDNEGKKRAKNPSKRVAPASRRPPLKNLPQRLSTTNLFPSSSSSESSRAQHKRKTN